MARLSAHGPELLRISCETDTPKSDLTLWERTTRTYHADGVVLEKRDVIFKPGPYDPPEGRRYTWGWKKKGKLKGDTREQVKTTIQIVEAGSKTSNWKVEFKQAGL